MTWRTPAALVVLLTIGVGTGFGASALAARQPVEAGVPTPVAAASPSLPIDPEPEYAEDPDVAALPAGLSMTEARIADQGIRHTFPVPDGWEATASSDGDEVRWRDPENIEPWTYLLRVEQVSDNKTVERMLQTRLSDLEADELDLEVLTQTESTLTFSYVDTGHLRVSIVRWLHPPSSPFADLEIAATGRERDLPGMRALVETVAAGVRRR